MKYVHSYKFDDKYLKENMMGPNAVKLLEEMLDKHPIPADSRVLDLGCGRGLTSILMSKYYGLRVIAADLWISPTDNRIRFDEAGVEAIPIYAEAHMLPFAHEFFDAVVSIDSYQYFGCDPEYLEKHLLPIVKHGGYILIVVPGLRSEPEGDYPDEMLVSWTREDLVSFHNIKYWSETIKATKEAEVISIEEMEGFEECWRDWLECDNEHAVTDRGSMDAGAGKYMNFIAMVIRRK